MAGPSLLERIEEIERILAFLQTHAESALGTLRTGTISSFNPDTYKATVSFDDGVTVEGVTVSEHIHQSLCTLGAACVVAIFGESASDYYVIATYGKVPPDPFDPVTGHKHRGILHDGPKLD